MICFCSLVLPFKESYKFQINYRLFKKLFRNPFKDDNDILDELLTLSPSLCIRVGQCPRSLPAESSDGLAEQNDFNYQISS